jgi:hypothetical protein
MGLDVYVNPCLGNEVINLLLTMSQGFHDAPAHRVGKGLESA